MNIKDFVKKLKEKIKEANQIQCPHCKYKLDRNKFEIVNVQACLVVPPNATLIKKTLRCPRCNQEFEAVE